ncbi:MAG: hypothetical protein HC935_03925 [Pseudanabaena sp. SU_2_4]|nr:hypothetical protein [Pseudanabaena sp. SU_2_4]
MNINLNIERLILDEISIPHAQRPLLQAAVEAELGLLLAESGVGESWRMGGAVPRVLASPIQLSANSNYTQWGQQIARSVYGGISS